LKNLKLYCKYPRNHFANPLKYVKKYSECTRVSD
jgi:hypothetical protein